MRSATGFAASIALLLALPLAIAASIAFGEPGADFAIHFAVGLGCVLIAIAASDFELPAWATWFGRATAGLFGGIFLLQAVSQVADVEALNTLAFDILGQGIERVLPYGILAWFVAVLIGASEGLTRIIGWTLVSVVIGSEVAGQLAPIIGIEYSSFQVLFLLPLVWFLIESAKRRPGLDGSPVTRRRALVESPTT